MSRRLLIVNADDLGRTRGLNAGILAAHERGIVTSATLMVGFAAASEAARELPRYPRLGVGLHVALTGATPVLPASAVRSLVDAAGRFPAKPEGIMNPDPAEVEAEVRAQLARFRELTGQPPTHLDSHHHAHRLPVVCEVLVRVAGEYGLPVRNSSPAVGRCLREAGVPTTDAFVEHFFGEEATLEVLLEILASLAPGATELMCHPGVDDPELAASSSYVEARLRELEVLTHPAVRHEVEEEGIDLGTFRDLCAS